MLTNTYFVGSPSQATVPVVDGNEMTNVVAVAELNAPVGNDYHSGNSSLILSVNFSETEVGGSPVNFARLSSSGTSNAWSSLSGMGAPILEINLAIIKVATNGWTANDMYFGTAQTGKIGRITANGGTVNTSWATLTGETNCLGGSLYQDQTGLFGHDLIVVTGHNSGSEADSVRGGAVWRVTSSGSATNLAQLESPNGERLLEGVVTLPNDTAKYGPWAGKILTCQVRSGLIWAVDANGMATAYNLGLEEPDDLRLIPSDQPLYCADVFGNKVWKVPAGNFAGFAGDILVVNERGCAGPGLFIVHWDGGRFVVRQITVTGATRLEHCVFAPIDIPALP